jgi:hypothetical protein
MRWGRNVVSVAPTAIVYGGATTRAFQVDFNQSGISSEAQAVVGDSGGAVFLKRSGQWQLVGVMFLIGAYTGQPYQSTVVFGQYTLSADVAFYRAQLESIMHPSPQIPALPWPALGLGAAGLVAVAHTALRRRARRERP